MTASPPIAAPAEAPLPLSRVILAAWPLLASIMLLMIGSGLQGSLLGVRADAARFNSTLTGLILGLYYLGYVAGSTWVPSLIRSVGHIRVFGAFASTASAAVVVHGVWVSPIPWLVLRFVTGVCIAGLFVVSESWLNDVATIRTRATLLAVYNTVVTAGLTVGSLLLNVADAAGFVLFVIGSVMLSMAAVPVALAPIEAPVPEASTSISIAEVFRAAPLGLVGSVMSGFGSGSALGFGAIYATRAGFGVSGASQFVAAILIGAVVGQIPLGNWSDRTDRRIVMGVASGLLAAGSAVGIAGTLIESFPVVLVAGLLVGAGAFSLYGLSFAHMADYIDPHKMVSAGARLITVNGLGAAAGPISASVIISTTGPEGLFQMLMVAAAFFCVFVVIRLFQREAAEDHGGHFIPVSTGATFASLDEIASETTGVEVDHLHPPRRPRMATVAQAARAVPNAAKRAASKAASVAPKPGKGKGRSQGDGDRPES